MPVYPSQIDYFATHTDNNNEKINASHINILQNSITALENMVGIYTPTTGTANNYIITNPSYTSYTEGMAIVVKINVDNTGSSTVNINGLGTKSVKRSNGNDIGAGNLKAGSIYTFRYNGINFILQAEGGGGSALAKDILVGETAMNDSGYVTGNMPNLSGRTIMPTTTDQIIGLGYDDGTSKVQGDIDLIPENIVVGKNIFGIQGTCIKGNYASGGITDNFQSSAITYNFTYDTTSTGDDAKYYYSKTGLTFTPKVVIIYPKNLNGNPTIYHKDGLRNGTYGESDTIILNNSHAYQVRLSGTTATDGNINGFFLPAPAKDYPAMWFAFG